MSYDGERQRIPDHLDTVLPSGRTVLDAVNAADRARREESLRRALKHSGGERKLNRWARLFTAWYGR